MNTRRWLLLLAAALLTLTGCEDVTGGGGKEIEVYVVTNGGAQGTVQLDASVSLFTAQGAEVTVGTMSHTTNIAGGAQTLFTRRRVDAVEYTRARVVFTQVAAEVTGGLAPGGVPLLGRLDVDIPAGGNVILERSVEMTLAARPREVLVIHLNTAAWLPTVNTLTRRVPVASFRNALDLRHE